MSAKPWPFQKLVFISPTAPALDLAEGIDPPTTSAGFSTPPVVCVVCGGWGKVPDSLLPPEPRGCSVCDGSGQIGGGS